MKLIRKENGDYHLVINDEIKSLQEFNITKDDCDTLTLGYSVEKMAVNSFGHRPGKDDNDILFSLGKGYVRGYQQGFKAHQEFVKDIYKEAIESMQEFVERVDKDEIRSKRTYAKFKTVLNSLVPKTEWDIEFDEQGKIKLL